MLRPNAEEVYFFENQRGDLTMHVDRGYIVDMLVRIKRKFQSLIKMKRNRILAQGKTKYFCIGRNKTGTTSLKKAFEDFGFSVGDQCTAERLAHRYYFNGEFEPIIEYCESAQAFQDVPFSWPETYKHLDRAYPGSKFILTLRDDAEQWYRSITRFHAKVFGNGNIPSSGLLKSAGYAAKGFMYNTVKIHGTPDDDPYNKKTMIAHYEAYNRDVLEYFKNRPEDLLVINIAADGDFQRFCEFIKVEMPQGAKGFPWENKT